MPELLKRLENGVSPQQEQLFTDNAGEIDEIAAQLTPDEQHAFYGELLESAMSVERVADAPDSDFAQPAQIPAYHRKPEDMPQTLGSLMYDEYGKPLVDKYVTPTLQGLAGMYQGAAHPEAQARNKATLGSIMESPKTEYAMSELSKIDPVGLLDMGGIGMVAGKSVGDIAGSFGSRLSDRLSRIDLPDEALGHEMQRLIEGGKYAGEKPTKHLSKWEYEEVTGMRDYLQRRWGEPVTRKEIEELAEKGRVEIGAKEFDPGYEEYKLSGGENYRGMLMTLDPEKHGKAPSTHFGENEFVHIRMDDRTGPNGEKVLMIQEIQSDWARDLRKGESVMPLFEKKTTFLKSMREKYGVNSTAYNDIVPKMDANEQMQLKVMERDYDSAYGYEDTPDMPFKQGRWQDAAIKQILEYARENDYARVAWVNSEQAYEFTGYPGSIYDDVLVKKFERHSGEKAEGIDLSHTGDDIPTEDPIGNVQPHDGVVDDDPENWAHTVEDIEGGHQEVTWQGKQYEYDDLVEAIREEELADNPDFYKVQGEERLNREVRQRVDELVEFQAKEWYMYEPYYKWDLGDTGWKIQGNDDVGYNIYSGETGQWGAAGADKGIYDFHEAVQAVREDGDFYVYDGDGSTVQPEIQLSIPITEKYKKKAKRGIPLFTGAGAVGLGALTGQQEQ